MKSRSISRLLSNSVLDKERGDDVSERPTETTREKPRTTATSTTFDLSYEVETQGELPGETLASKEVLLAVVDAFFIYCHNQPYSFFHEGNFRRGLSQGSLPEHLLLAVLASAVRFSRHAYFNGRWYQAAVGYANRSWKSVVSSCITVSRTADVSIVQTIALLALFDFTAGQSRHGSAWVKIGMAVRIAQDLGLMLDAAPYLPYPEQEERRRVFWSVYLLDRLVSCGRGRPPAIVDASCHLQLPCDDTIWKNGLWQKTPSLDDLSNRALLHVERQGHFAHVIVMSYALGRGAQYMLQEYNIRSRYPPWDSSSDFAALELELMHLETHLETNKSIQEMITPHISAEGAVDHQSVGPIIFSRALFHLCYCMLNHPFLLRERLETSQLSAPASFLARAFETAWQHAQRMIELIRNSRRLGCVFQSSFSGYCMIVAGSIAALNVHHNVASTRATAEALLYEAIAYLEDVGQYWANVATMAQLLRHLAENALLFRQLSCDQPQIQPLSQATSETMWSLVDYSTMSNDASTGLMENQSHETNLWFDSWFGMFGNMDIENDFGIIGNDSNTANTMSA
ncbi:uncharacterized protein A1O9_01203 [Exophiala aquamarina CBS 119918]|uniref:Xylanolytic transcriptional activator regulatory domain-containing protein n=1 Tax=Exophiala aquamarina CBS 119918 TaxID=1182545 RepID=A0A072PTP6_9EURO|nr:uncharacterized protein A1O9_01203 [Exophiala aquamarina CBS 119918]KEF63226.1 hypothetical protein A1O9_01203 [Exophiala aquamarina CBS 119918]